MFSGSRGIATFVFRILTFSYWKMAENHARQNYSIPSIATFLRQAPPDTFPVRRHSHTSTRLHTDHGLVLEGKPQTLPQSNFPRTGVQHLLGPGGTTKSTSRTEWSGRVSRVSTTTPAGSIGPIIPTSRSCRTRQTQA
jgi:hypothetical protein